MQGSAQLLFVTKVKPDPLDTTIAMSDLVASSSNADYDGEFVAVVKLLLQAVALINFFNCLGHPARRAGYCEAKAKANA